MREKSLVKGSNILWDILSFLSPIMRDSIFLFLKWRFSIMKLNAILQKINKIAWELTFLRYYSFCFSTGNKELEFSFYRISLDWIFINRELRSGNLIISKIWKEISFPLKKKLFLFHSPYITVVRRRFFLEEPETFWKFSATKESLNMKLKSFKAHNRAHFRVRKAQTFTASLFICIYKYTHMRIYIQMKSGEIESSQPPTPAWNLDQGGLCLPSTKRDHFMEFTHGMTYRFKLTRDTRVRLKHDFKIHNIYLKKNFSFGHSSYFSQLFSFSFVLEPNNTLVLHFVKFDIFYIFLLYSFTI